MSNNNITVTDESIMSKIYVVRGQKVMMDSDLAALYGVETKVFNQAVKRNYARFPEDFAFRVTNEEFEALRSQIVTLKKGRGQHSKYLPMVFSESGVAMLSSVLSSELAIKVNIQIIRIFNKMREMWLTHKDILLKLEELENKVSGHDREIQVIFEYLKELLNPPQPPRRRIGFNVKDED
ncbi:ORF6N domain-containing protein [Arachidicoccus rhizosphaerae]|uniref:ORF6N domain-containing protein n=1 Tax=Arachidicoccus rhizosphaerae TaxID=551991 RepID=A0A1H4BVQ3_9BACT|nr:ORF6N domain-containing protein [Arachidicoccus rhizosphaerae]SEA51912.1 ORF6N domain-containing protein [Arachidicoccus rhizosphaerae]